jgi:hypothetical protein
MFAQVGSWRVGAEIEPATGANEPTTETVNSGDDNGHVPRHCCKERHCRQETPARSASGARGADRAVSRPLLAQTLAASTYPLEIVQLHQYMLKYPKLKDQALVDSIKKQPWDPIIQSMAPSPTW